jgi:uncharacterized protein involved in exopolysaccharide biosynthesis
MNKTAPTSKPEQAFDLNLREIAAPLFRHVRAISVVFVVVLLLAGLVDLMWASHYYRAEMEVLVQEDRSDPAISATQSAASTEKTVSPDIVPSEIELLTGMDMMRTVVDSCDLVDYSWTLRDLFRTRDQQRLHAIKHESAAISLSKHVKATATVGSDVITVTYGKLGDPKQPACVLQSLAKEYMAKHALLSRPAGSATLFAVEADRYKDALQAVEANLIAFSKSESVAAPELQKTDLAQQLGMQENALSNIYQLMMGDKSRLSHDRAKIATIPSRSLTSETSNAPNLLLQNLQTTLLTDMNRRTQLLVKYAPTYPLVHEVDQEIALTQAAIKNIDASRFTNSSTDRDPIFMFLSEDAAKTEADLETQTAAAASLQGSIRDTRYQLIRMNELAIQQGQMEREAKSDEASYMLYLAKRDQERTTDAIDQKGVANVAIAVPATVPILPAYGNTVVLLIGLLGAFVLSIVSAYIFEYFDSTFTTPTQITEALGLTVLASVPDHPSA